MREYYPEDYDISQAVDLTFESHASYQDNIGLGIDTMLAGGWVLAVSTITNMWTKDQSSVAVQNFGELTPLLQTTGSWIVGLGALCTAGVYLCRQAQQSTLRRNSFESRISEIYDSK